MMPSIVDAHRIVPKFWFLIGFLNLFAVAIFYPIMCCNEPKHFQVSNLLTVIGVAAVTGLGPGVYLTFRTKFDSLYVICIQPYFIFMLEIILAGSSVAFAVLLADRSDLRWLAFNINAVCMVSTLLASMYLEAKELGFWKYAKPWREEIEKFIDYSKNQVNPLLMKTYKPRFTFKHPILIAMVGAANIPLLFDIYGGGRVNAVFLAAPLIMCSLAYFNIKAIGPGFTRLLLLRKIEKEVGYRFQNADYEQIQELRRGFFMAEWLMKDYRPPQAETSNAVTAAQQEQTPRQRKHKRR